MGIESFYLTFLDPDIVWDSIPGKGNFYFGHTNLTIDEVRYRLDDLPFRIDEYDDFDDYKVNGLLRLCLLDEDGFFQGFFLEACFSWYRENLELIMDFALSFNSVVSRLRVSNPIEDEIAVEDRGTVINRLSSINAGRYSAFCNSFGERVLKSMPNGQFYRRYRRAELFPFLYRWYNR